MAPVFDRDETHRRCDGVRGRVPVAVTSNNTYFRAASSGRRPVQGMGLSYQPQAATSYGAREGRGRDAGDGDGKRMKL
jgi:hypothetical protein